MKLEALLLAAAACCVRRAAPAAGGDDDDGGRGGRRPARQVSGSVSMMGIWTGEEQKSFQAVVDAFKEAEPDVEGQVHRRRRQPPDRARTAVEGGNPPDVAASPSRA